MLNNTSVSLDDIKALIAEHSGSDKSDLHLNTRLGEDLFMLGDDADEFLEVFSKLYKLDYSEFSFHDYFPEEVTSNMFYYQLRHKKSVALNVPILRFINKIKCVYWGFFADKKQYKTLTLKDLYNSASVGKWVLPV